MAVDGGVRPHGPVDPFGEIDRGSWSSRKSPFVIPGALLGMGGVVEAQTYNILSGAGNGASTVTSESWTEGPARRKLGPGKRIKSSPW